MLKHKLFVRIVQSENINFNKISEILNLVIELDLVRRIVQLMLCRRLPIESHSSQPKIICCGRLSLVSLLMKGFLVLRILYSVNLFRLELWLLQVSLFSLLSESYDRLHLPMSLALIHVSKVHINLGSFFFYFSSQEYLLSQLLRTQIDFLIKVNFTWGWASRQMKISTRRYWLLRFLNLVKWVDFKSSDFRKISFDSYVSCLISQHIVESYVVSNEKQYTL